MTYCADLFISVKTHVYAGFSKLSGVNYQQILTMYMFHSFKTFNSPIFKEICNAKIIRHKIFAFIKKISALYIEFDLNSVMIIADCSVELIY